VIKTRSPDPSDQPLRQSVWQGDRAQIRYAHDSSGDKRKASPYTFLEASWFPPVRDSMAAVRCDRNDQRSA
jgi:hypothetical protein